MAYTLSQFCDRQKHRIKKHLASQSFFRGGKKADPNHYIGQLMSLEDGDEWRAEDMEDEVFEYRRGLDVARVGCYEK